MHQLVADGCDHSDDDACAKALQKTQTALSLCSGHPKSWATFEFLGAVQNRMQNLLSALHRGPEATRTASIKLHGALLRHGLVKPHNAVAHLVAAHADASPTVRNTARELLLLEIWRSPDVLNAENVSTGAKACRGIHNARSQQTRRPDERDRTDTSFSPARPLAVRRRRRRV